MPELRRDPVDGRWVIIAAERAHRPFDSAEDAGPQARGECPFCEGNEKMTPPEIAALRPAGLAADSPGWRVRLVPNKYPALELRGDTCLRKDGPLEQMTGIGSHEVLVETPRHTEQLADQTVSAVTGILRVCRDRMRHLLRDERIRYVMFFKNHGLQAGASRSHPHAQLVALPVIPKHVQEEMDGMEKRRREDVRCIYCALVAREIRDEIRLVTANDQFAAFTAYAPRKPYETWIVPRVHRAEFQRAEDLELASLAAILRETLRRLRRGLDDPPFNLLLHTAPKTSRGRSAADGYHWHLEILPTVTRVAGFEWGTGFHISHISPERAAVVLREAGQDGC